ncbi:hypothetical protein BRD19_04065 [Halobacteriales archaeon SW_7_65_23]|nr:MAG: hypothetical protein BRD19_04065 [Halobacteriales archaeon SW_7_65_23]
MEPTITIGEIPESVTNAVSIEVIIDNLADPQRRQLLAVLRRRETPERLSTLARHLAHRTEGEKPESVEQIHLRLYHVHVPKLVDAGFVSREDEGTDLTDAGRALADAIAE